MVDLALLSVRRVIQPKVSSTHTSLYVVSVLSLRVEVFVCVGALAILDRLDEVDQERLAWWLAERQLPNGGLNGRPEKLADVSVVSCVPTFCSNFGGRFVIASGCSRQCPS